MKGVILIEEKLIITLTGGEHPVCFKNCPKMTSYSLKTSKFATKFDDYQGIQMGIHRNCATFTVDCLRRVSVPEN